jgi:hypothetical protein
VSVSRRVVLCALLLCVAAPLAAQTELGYEQYRAVMSAAERLDHLCTIESLETAAGPFVAVADRFGLVRVYQLTGDGSREIWTSKQLNGTVQQVLSADLDGDGSDEIVAWTSMATFYVWSSRDYRLLFETLQNDFRTIHSLAIGQVDDDAPLEIVVNADLLLHYYDGVSFNRQWTSLHEYEATRLAIGDVDGDHLDEIVLNTGQVLDSRSGDVEWEDEVFGNRIQLVDIDGDGLPEVLTESDGALMRIYDVDHRREKLLQ